jgi:hypothetical protein
MVMRLSVQGLAWSGALLWGGCLLVLSLANLAVPAYGGAFLQGVGSVYPGFYHARSFADVLVGTMYGVVDGALGGALLAWLYNSVTRA